MMPNLNDIPAVSDSDLQIWSELTNLTMRNGQLTNEVFATKQMLRMMQDAGSSGPAPEEAKSPQVAELRAEISKLQIELSNTRAQLADARLKLGVVPAPVLSPKANRAERRREKAGK